MFACGGGGVEGCGDHGRGNQYSWVSKAKSNNL